MLIKIHAHSNNSKNLVGIFCRLHATAKQRQLTTGIKIEINVNYAVFSRSSAVRFLDIQMRDDLVLK